MQVIRQILDTGWQVREAPAAHIAPHNHLPWLPAQVPGHVHLDLMRAGVIPDPFVRLHERDVAWVDDTDWTYETTFHVDDPAPANAYLIFHGLDTVAEVALNGEPLGRTDNMYIPHEFSVNDRLKPGDNHLQITFRSARRIGQERVEAWNAGGNPTMPRHWDGWDVRSFVRKAQYMYGWDWGPVLHSCGLWRPVELVIVPVARLQDWKYGVEFHDGQAKVMFQVDVERAPGQEETPLSLTVNIPEIRYELYAGDELELGTLGGYATEDTGLPREIVDVPTGAGTVTVSASVTIENPVRWQPNGLTESVEFGPALYSTFLSLNAESDEETKDDGPVDHKQAAIGLRTIELVRDQDSDGQGEGFKFRVNGVVIFAKGANWIPDDSFPARLINEAGDPYPEKDTVGEGLKLARDAGFNMMRIWGGGLYESEHFYELCDAHGLLVWQDFPYACAYYPDTGEYAEAARVEATAGVRRIRNHPSLALWCGNNENATMYHGDWHGLRPSRYLGEKLYNEVLPAVVDAEDPRTPYWPSSPFGGDDPNSAQFGDCHNWDVWHGRGDWTHYTENDSRFCSEFGFGASCGLAAWNSVLAPGDRHPYSPAVRWHDKTRKGYDTYLGYVALHYPEPQTLEDLVYLTQINQAEALKYGIEHYRRRKGHCWGTLFWQFNDCWPVQSWAIVDYTGEPKAAYYACKKFYAPLLVSLVRDGETVTAHLTNDFPHAVEGTLTLTLETFEGVALSQAEHHVQVGPNGTHAVSIFDTSAAEGRERDVYLYARFQPGTAGLPVENLLLLDEAKNLRLPSPGVSLAVLDGPGDSLTLTVSAKRFAPYVWLRRSDDTPLAGLEDNFFHLRAGETRQIVLPRPEDTPTASELRGRLVVRTL